MASKSDFSLIIADDHPMLLNGLHKELESNGYTVIGKAADGMEALSLIIKHQPSVALLDIDMPLLSGFEVIRMAKEKQVNTKFVVLSYHKEVDYIARAKTLNIDGYLLKEDSFFEIERCIEAVMNNEVYFSQSFDNLALKNANDELKKLQYLTPSEITILKMIAKGTSNIEIADTLSLSKRTVEKHRSNIIARLEIEGGTNALTNWTLMHKDVILDL